MARNNKKKRRHSEDNRDRDNRDGRFDNPQANRQPRNLKTVSPRNEHQNEYMQAIENNVITIGAGPAGSGKTYLAVYEALKCHWAKDIKRIIITRPAVDAGEKLGFLPGDIKDKVDPYMRPIYDAFFDLIGISLTQEKMDRGYIEIAPLAFMRGRTFNNCFIILDEAQNATLEQLKMAVTRVGENCKLVINGDPLQTDLPKVKDKEVGLLALQNILEGVPNVAVMRFNSGDIVRSRVVIDVIKAFERYEQPPKSS